MPETIYTRILALLDAHGAPYDVTRHEPVFTSEEAARVRGTTLSSGAKALICKADGQFRMFVLPADRRLDSKHIRRALKLGSLRFASREEVEQLTSLQPGSIPPFGSLFELSTCCDERLASETTINFNAGDHSISLSMRYDDYLSVERPVVGRFAT